VIELIAEAATGQPPSSASSPGSSRPVAPPIAVPAM
jgi:hypothetical protein